MEFDGVWLKSGLFGDVVQQWLAAGPSDWRGAVFLVGAIVGVFLIAVLWNSYKLLALTAVAAVGVLIGLETAAGIFVMSLILAFVGRPRSNAGQSPAAGADRPKGSQKMTFAEDMALGRMDEQAARILTREEYSRYRADRVGVKTSEDAAAFALRWQGTFDIRCREIEDRAM